MIPFARYECLVVVDQLMRKTAIIKAAVALPTIGIYRAARLYMLFNESLKRCTLDVRDSNCSHGSIALNEPDHGSFASGAPTSLPFSSAAKVRFVNLNMARQLVSEGIAFNGLSDLRKHVPGGLVGYPNLIFQLIGRDPDLKQRDRTYPFRDRCSRLLKDSAGRLRKPILTAPALVFKAVLLSEFPDRRMPTCGTSYPSRPANFIKKPTTLAFIDKIKSIIVQSHEDLLHLDFDYPSIQLVPQRG